MDVFYLADIDLQGQVEGSLLMPPAYQTVVSRAQLALVSTVYLTTIFNLICVHALISAHQVPFIVVNAPSTSDWEGSGSVVECLSRDRRAAG